MRGKDSSLGATRAIPGTGASQVVTGGKTRGKHVPVSDYVLLLILEVSDNNFTVIVLRCSCQIVATTASPSPFFSPK